jgi:hypothetical protein
MKENPFVRNLNMWSETTRFGQLPRTPSVSGKENRMRPQFGVGPKLDIPGRRAGACQKFRTGENIANTERAMTKPTSFQQDIRPLFTDRDIHAMSKAFDLASYDDVKTHAAVIYDRIRGIGGAVMPPPPPRGEGPWPQARIELFAQWMADGYQP